MMTTPTLTKAVVLLSGGIDSTTALAVARQDNHVVLAVSFDYGSKHNEAESQAAEEICKHYEVERVVVPLPRIFGGADSALMGDIPMPHLSYQEIDEHEGPSPTVVPFRNANLISMATTIAITNNAQYVYIAAHGEDAHNWAYPDCTPEFLGAMANAIYVGSYREVRLQFPFIWMTKADVVDLGMRMRIPAGLTWSCYDPVMKIGPSPINAEYGPKYIHCGKCPTCIERKHAFEIANWSDPTEYANDNP